MFNLNIKATKSSPAVNYDSSTKCLNIEGRSIQENPQVWYDDLWIKIEAEIYTERIKKLRLAFEYFNTASAKQIFHLLKKFQANTINETIIWAYESDDEDMKEAGEDYQEMLETEFRFEVC